MARFGCQSRSRESIMRRAVIIHIFQFGPEIIFDFSNRMIFYSYVLQLYV
jgi:hypothetical protein